MSENHSKAVSRDARIKKGMLHRLFGIYELVLISLIAFSLIGIAITDFSPKDSHRYWLAMIPVFAGACLILEWSRARGKGQKWVIILRNQVLHWAGLLVAVQLVYCLA